MRRISTALVVCVATGLVACSSSTPSSPSSPSTPSTPATSGTCRTFASAATVSTTTLGLTQNATLTGAFNTSANQSTVTTNFVPGGLCTTTVNTYRSTADFVDEVRVIPGLLMQTGTLTTNGPACGSGTSAVAYTYDSLRRLTSFSSGGSATTYTAWDASGRPTAGSFAGTTISNVYNDAARTTTQTQTMGGTVSTTTSTFDANGIQLTVVNTTAGITSTTTFTNTSTAQVCK
jgi:YD repeat-containing protein